MSEDTTHAQASVRKASIIGRSSHDRWRVGGLVIGELCVPQTEAVVMLGGDDEVFLPAAAAALAHIVGSYSRVEELEILFVLFVWHLFLLFDPFVTRRQSITGPVNKQTKTGRE
jgi:hypothetical protein